MARIVSKVRMVLEFVRQEDGSYTNEVIVCNPEIVETDPALSAYDKAPRNWVFDKKDLEKTLPDSVSLGQIKNQIRVKIKQQASTAD